MHYQRAKKRDGHVGGLASERQARTGLCVVDGCESAVLARGLCGMHYDRMADTGRLGGPLTKMGKGSVHHSGYRYIQFDGKSVGEHRLVMECMLGRKLRPHENVHHRDGDRLNNEPENLELWTKRQPPGQRPADVVKAAIAVLKDYPERTAAEGYRLLALESAEATDYFTSHPDTGFAVPIVLREP